MPFFALSEETRERISRVIEITKQAVHWGFIPMILYIGYTRSAKQISLIKLISPLAA
ncbi:translocase of the outer mitochondrial membrane [Saitoella coloradoensis]|uniref:TOM7 family protein n=1 Tax=Saitoella complicata (strain BCRC 22490 / CBS 7301 / JCM 7358 / NBRC 10748 / NRRL Y-17804) TaxID=698492 RepID=UPI000866FA64|nr:TOM7 family protein [Saitoella complicata NRRL Y-17804]ODQ51935.1 TOM7 family protein [Saitoella complicata NRRL Y-17804]